MRPVCCVMSHHVKTWKANVWPVSTGSCQPGIAFRMLIGWHLCFGQAANPEVSQLLFLCELAWSVWAPCKCSRAMGSAHTGRDGFKDLYSGAMKLKDTLPKNIHVVKVMVFLVVMYRCESWTTKRAENWRADAFKLWCWRRLWESLELHRDQTSQS